MHHSEMMKQYFYFVLLTLAIQTASAQVQRTPEIPEFKKQLNTEPDGYRFRTRGATSLKEAVERSGGMSNVQFMEGGEISKKRYIVSLLLPFSSTTTLNRIEASLSARETGAKPPLISEEAKSAFEFYDGVLYAMKAMQDSMLEMELHVYDTWNSDSVTKELLKNKTIQYSNIIIGPVSHATSKLVADFCKQRKIINIQPFTPSKSITHDNPYHIKIAPTIDAHIDNIVRSLADSFMRENIIIYCMNQESSLQAASRLDSLLKNFDAPGKTRFTSTLFNYSNPVVNGTKKSLNDLFHPTKRNVVVVCVFDESNAQMVVKQLAERKAEVIAYGMPTWLNSEILRLDYLNKLSARFTEQYVFDTTIDERHHFYYNFYHEFGTYPGRYVWLGYDVAKWLEKSLLETSDFPFNIAGSFYSGVGNKFQFREVKTNSNGSSKTDYIENTYLHLLRMEDYVLKKEW